MIAMFHLLEAGVIDKDKVAIQEPEKNNNKEDKSNNKVATQEPEKDNSKEDNSNKQISSMF